MGCYINDHAIARFSQYIKSPIGQAQMYASYLNCCYHPEKEAFVARLGGIHAAFQQQEKHQIISQRVGNEEIFFHVIVPRFSKPLRKRGV